MAIGYPSKTIALDISLRLKPGELTGVIGINGAGKSTLLQTLTGTLPALNGKILLNAESLSSLSPQHIAEQVSVVFTEKSFSKNLSVKELVALGRTPYSNWIGRLNVQDKELINKSLRKTGIEALASRKCSTLSDGQLQKVLIARTLAQNTPLIVLDEPTAHLDVYHKVFVLRLLKQITRETQKTIVFASHEINLVLQLCDQIILVDHEKVIQKSPDRLISEGYLENLFPSDIVQFDPVSRNFKILK